MPEGKVAKCVRPLVMLTSGGHLCQVSLQRNAGGPREGDAALPVIHQRKHTNTRSEGQPKPVVPLDIGFPGLLNRFCNLVLSVVKFPHLKNEEFS